MASHADDHWSVENINLLLDKRIAREELFKPTKNMGWIYVLVDMKKSGVLKSLHISDVELQWSKLCETYKKLTENHEELEKQINTYPYFGKLHSYFKSLNVQRKINATEGDKRKFSTELLIDRRIARNNLFEKADGRKFIGRPWRTVCADLIKLGEPETTTPVHLKNRWYNLVIKYKKLKNEDDEAKDWPYFQKLDDFFKGKIDTSDGTIFDNKPESSTKILEIHDPDCISDQNENKKVRTYRKRWSFEQTRLLIESRIMRKAMFEKKGRAFYGWQLVMSDLKQAGALKDLSFQDVQKKWHTLCDRYKIIMDKKCSNPRWVHFQQMNNYLKEKYDLRKKKVMNSEKAENMATESEYSVVIDWDLEQEKLSKCRLCQQNKSDHSLLADEALCKRIMRCTSLKIRENAAYLPPGVCDTCKTTTNIFYDFLTRCRGVDKALRTSIPVLNVQTQSSSTEVRNIYECAECFATFTSIDMLEIHLKTHDRFHCKICNASFTRKHSLQLHMKNHFTKLAAKEQNNENTMEYVNNSEMMTNESSSIDNVEININAETSDQYNEIISTDELMDSTELTAFEQGMKWYYLWQMLPSNTGFLGRNPIKISNQNEQY